jgi:sugar transferase EpsL
MDILVAGALLLVLLPVIIVLAIIVRFSLGKPVLFVHERPGKGGKTFALYKFRTMTSSRDPQGNLLPDAERLTATGRRIRQLSLDELPTLWNVLIGDMSLVGPRPLLTEYLDHYSDEQARRHEVRPGITGWAQVHGRNLLNWQDKFKLDVWYVDNWSLRLDANILLRTVWLVLTGKGVSHPGEATMKRFHGND